MADLLEELPRRDRDLLRAMAADAGTSTKAMSLEILRAYLSLVRGAPQALPADPLRRLASSAIRGRRG